MLGTMVDRQQVLKLGKSKLESGACYLFSHLTSDKFLNVSELHFPICKMGTIIVSVILYMNLLLYLVTVVIKIGTP